MGHSGGQPGTRTRAQRRAALAPVAALGLVLLTACGGGPTLVAPTPGPDSVATTEALPPTPLPATPAPRPASIGDILWSDGEQATATPVAGASQLTINAPRIVASVPAYSVPAGSQVAAAWFYNDTSLDAFATTLTIEQTLAEQWLEFQLTRNPEAPWPAGVYEISISLNGQTAQTASIEVVSPS